MLRISGALLAIMIPLFGCASFEGYPSQTVKADQTSICPVSAAGLTGLSREAYDSARNAPTKTDPERQRLRNIFIDTCLGAINTSYTLFARNLTSDQKTFNVGSDFAASGLTAASTLAKSARTKSHLTTYATGVLGLRTSVEKEVFFSKTLPALIAQMSASRKVVLAQITEGRTRSDAEYSLDTALLDLQSYYEAGTLTSAITEVTNDAGEKSKKASAEIAQINRYKSTADDLTDKLYGYIAIGTAGADTRTDEVAACSPSASLLKTPQAARLEALRVAEAGKRDERAEIVGCLKAKGKIQ